MDTINTKANKEYYTHVEEEESIFSIAKIYEMLVLNWQWFLLSVIVCLAAGAFYLKRTVPIYQVSADFLVKEDMSRGRKGTDVLSNITSNGFILNSEGIDNEVRILHSKLLARQAVINLGLYTNVSEPDGLRRKDIYKNPPILVGISNPSALDILGKVIVLNVEKKKGIVSLKGSYALNDDNGGESFDVDLRGKLPITLKTKMGPIVISENPANKMEEGKDYVLAIGSPDGTAQGYVRSLTVEPMSKTTTIAHLTITNSNYDRACDFLTELLDQYNEQANADKNEIALKTEEFINDRLEKISAELGSTESELENYKKRNSVVNMQLNAGSSLQSQTNLENKLDEATMQLQLLDYLAEYLDNPANKYQIIPSNIGLDNPPALALIADYNKLVTERNRMLLYSSETSPSVLPLTEGLDKLEQSLRNSLNQTKRSALISQKNLAQQFSKYSGRVGQTPEQERVLTSIGRQQEVRSSLYIMLLEKREENSLSLSATANKGRMIDDPVREGQTSPKKMMVMLIALLLGLAIPYAILYIFELLRYKIEGHEDLQKLTNVPIIADVMLCEQAKDSKAGIVVHADKNGTMEEIFRGIRTNIGFLLKENQNVVLFTSSIAGEGKTFNAANTAMSFALLKKRVVLVGLDIRKPRLGELFGFRNVSRRGITNLLRQDSVTRDEVMAEITPSGVNDYLDILMAGPIPPNPAEQLQGKALDEVIDVLRKEYDYVILDTAPVGLVTDTIIISRVADATIYVSRADYTPKEEIKMLNDLVEQKKLKNVSVVLNGVDMSQKKYGYKYGYGKYGKYGKYARYGRRYSYGYGSYHYGYGYGNNNGQSNGKK